MTLPTGPTRPRPRPAFVILLLAAVLAAAPPTRAADEATLDARDLLQPGPAATRHGPFPQGHPVLQDGFTARSLPGSLLLGLRVGDDDESGGAENEALLGEEDLRTALWSLAGDAAEGIDVSAAEGCVIAPASGVEVARTALAAVRAAAPSPVGVRLSLVAPGNPAPRILLSGEGPVAPGTLEVFGEVSSASALVDYDVEVAEASVIACPSMREQRTGAAVAFRIRPFPRGRRALVELVVRSATPRSAEPIDPGHPGFGPMDRGALEVEEAGLTFTVRRGEETVHRWTAADGTPRELRFRADWAAPPADRPGLALSWSRLFRGMVVGFDGYCYRRPWGEEPEPVDPFLEIDSDAALSRAVSGSRSSVVATTDSGLVILRGEDAGAVADALDDAIARRCPSANVEIRAYDVPAGATPGAGGAPPEGARLLAEARGPVTEGLRACFHGLAARRYLATWDVEIASSARIPDPRVWAEESGSTTTVDLRGGSDGAPGSVTLHLVLRRLEGMDRVVMALDQSQPGRVVRDLGPDNNGDLRPDGNLRFDPSLPVDRVAIEKPRIVGLDIHAVVPVAGGATAVLRRSATAYLGEGREVLVLVSAASR